MPPSQRLRLWLTQPMYVPRWGLLAKYAAIAAVGIIGIANGIKTLETTTPESYTHIWAAFVVGFAVLAALGVSVRALEHLETVAVPMLLSFISVLFLTTGSPVFQGFLVAVVTIPASRLPYLLGRLWRSVVGRAMSRRGEAT